MRQKAQERENKDRVTKAKVVFLGRKSGRKENNVVVKM